MNARMHARGVTLIELMIAMTIGLLVTAAVGSVYIGNKQTYRTSESVARLQEEARFTTIHLRNAIQQAGFFGRLDSSTLINGRHGSGSDLANLAGDCAGGWYIHLDRPVESPDTSGGNPYSGSCLEGNNLRNTHLAGTDLLVVRRASAEAVPDSGSAGHEVNHADNVGHVYLRADVRRGELFVSDGSTIPAGYDTNTVENRELIVEMFYVTPDGIESGDSIPTLRRLYLSESGGATQLRSERFARNVENFQVQFGEDTNADGNADRFVDPASAVPEKAVSVRVWLLFRSEILEADYTAPDKIAIAGADYEIPDGTEHYRRLLVTQTYTLRNL